MPGLCRGVAPGVYLAGDEDVKGARFITMVVALVSSDGQIDLVSAGHGPTLLFQAASRTVECFGGDGLPLGVVASETYGPRRRIRLESGLSSQASRR